MGFLVPGREWMERAACREVDDPDIFFPIIPRGKNARVHNKRAVDICRTCPVIDECLDYALEANEPYGIWGGLTTRERRDLRRESKLEGTPYSSLIAALERKGSTSS